MLSEGEFFSLDGWLAPALVRPAGPELWAARVSQATLRRTTRTGLWHPVAFHRTSFARRPRNFASGGRTAASCCASAYRSGPTVKPGATSAAVMDRGPPEWAIERLMEYVEAGCDGFVLNLDHGRPGLDERVLEFAEWVAALRRT